MRLLLLLLIFITTIICMAMQLATSYQLDDIQDRVDYIYDASCLYCQNKNNVDELDS